jgi:hypothetical protein
MPIMSKNVFIVRCDRETFENSFTRKKNSDIINHYEIHQKLTNNDSSKTPPSDEIVNYQIVKRLNSFRECRKTEFVFVLREKIDQNFIIRLKDFFGECFVPVFYHLLVDKEVKDKKLIKEFNTVSLLDHDKNSNS